VHWAGSSIHAFLKPLAGAFGRPIFLFAAFRATSSNMGTGGIRLAGNRERRKEVGKVFFDLSKYLLTTVAVGSIISEEVNMYAVVIAIIASFGLMALAYHITPPDQGN
jgi:hypothetical protein